MAYINYAFIAIHIQEVEQNQRKAWGPGLTAVPPVEGVFKQEEEYVEAEKTVMTFIKKKENAIHIFARVWKAHVQVCMLLAGNQFNDCLWSH